MLGFPKLHSLQLPSLQHAELHRNPEHRSQIHKQPSPVQSCCEQYGCSGAARTIPTDKSFTMSGHGGKRGASNVVRKVSVLLREERMAVLCWTGGSMKLRCDLARAKAMAEASWNPWRAPVITPQGFQWEVACPAHHETLKREQWTSDQYFSLFEGAGQSLQGRRLGRIFWASMPSWCTDIYPTAGPDRKHCWIYPKCKLPSWTKRCKLQISHRVTGMAPSLRAVSGLWESAGGQGHGGIGKGLIKSIDRNRDRRKEKQVKEVGQNREDAE